MKKKWWFIYNDISSSKEYFRIVNFISNMFNKENIQFKKVAISSLKKSLYQYISDSEFLPDYILFWDKSWELAKEFENIGISVLNSYNSAIICENKLETYKYLKEDNLIPMTLFFTVRQALQLTSSIINNISFPMLLKLEKSVLGNNVFFIKNFSNLVDFLKKMDLNEKIILQQYLNFKPNVEIKIFSTYNKVLSSYKRILQNDGLYKYEKCILDAKTQEMAIKCCNLLGLTFAGIDMLYNSENTFLITDVNTQPNVLKIFEVLQVNVISEILHICS